MATIGNWSIKNRILIDGKKLSDARVAAEKSMDEVAAIIGCNKGSVCKWERGRLQPSEERIYRLVEILGTGEFIIGNPNYQKRKHPAWNKGKRRNSQGDKEQEVKE